jgi:hypothetical protein
MILKRMQPTSLEKRLTIKPRMGPISGTWELLIPVYEFEIKKHAEQSQHSEKIR